MTDPNTPAVGAEPTDSVMPATTETETPQQPDERLSVLHRIMTRLVAVAHISDDERQSLHADLNSMVNPTAPNSAQLAKQRERDAKAERIRQLQAELDAEK